MFRIVAALTVLSGSVLYWRDSGGLQLDWIASSTGLAFTVGGLAAIIAFVGGAVLVGPGIAEQTSVRGELAAGDGVPTAAQRERLESADGRLKLAGRSCATSVGTRAHLPKLSTGTSVVLSAVVTALTLIGRER